MDYSWLMILFAAAGSFCQISAQSSKGTSSCPKPFISNGNYASEGAFAVIRCNEGYQLVGPQRLKCLSRRWLPGLNSVKCERQEVKSCSFPPEIPNGQVIPAKKGTPYVVGDEIRIHCDRDHRVAKGSDFLRCTEDGWNGAFPDCEATCFDLPKFDNGEWQYRDSEENREAFFVCAKGFQLDQGLEGKKCIHGNDGLQWIGKNPTCEPIRGFEFEVGGAVCPDPPKLENGKILPDKVGGKYYPGEEVTVTCDPTYFAVGGSSILRCLNTGEWDEAFPLCEGVTCESPEEPDDGVILELKENPNRVFNYGDIITYECEAGYHLIGQKRRMCSDTGWGSEDPTCVETQCGQIPDLSYSRPINYKRGKKWLPNEELDLECLLGFRPVNKDARLHLFCDGKGRWDTSNAICEAIVCEPPQEIENGKIEYDAPDNIFPYGTEIKYSCKKKMAIVGKATMRCTEEGWSEKLPVCKDSFCERPELESGISIKTSPAGYEDSASIPFGAEIIYECAADNYNLVGSSSQLCAEDGWTGRTPFCKLLGCTAPEAPENGNVERKWGYTRYYRFGEHARFYCNYKYMFEEHGGYNTQTARCMEDGTWTKIPKCIEVFCKLPPLVDNGKYINQLPIGEDKYPVNYVLTLKCNEGYTRAANSVDSRKCVNNGHWSYRQQFCEKVRCERPPDLPHAEMETDIYKASAYNTRSQYKQIKDLEAGFVVHYRCQEGYNLIIDHNKVPEIACLQTGQWSTPEFTCESVSCGQLPRIKNGYLRLEQYNNINLVGTKAVVSCDESYGALKTEIYCRPDGQWNVEDSVCQKLNTVPALGSNCGHPPNIANGLLSTDHYVNKYPRNSMALVYCDESYSASQKEVFCLNNGFWDVPHHLCRRTENSGCSRVPEIEHGYLNIYESFDPYPLGSKAQVICDQGFAAVTDLVACEGSWVVPDHVCVKSAKCGPVPIIANGFLKPPAGMKTFPIGTSAQVNCEPGYITNSVFATCQEPGVWNLTNARCHKEVKHCRRPPTSPDVIVLEEPKNRQLYPLQHEIRYACKNEKSTIIGSPINVCTQSGWIQEASPSCSDPMAEKCDPIPTVRNGTLKIVTNGPLRPFEYSVRIDCDPGYRAQGEYLKCGATGKWDPNDVKCERDKSTDCTAPDDMENGRIERIKNSKQATYPMEYKVTYKCFGDYILVGEATRVCTDGGWSGDVPVCKARFCSGPIVDGVRENRRYQAGQTFQRRCPPGEAVLEGSGLIECLEGGVWSNQVPECQEYTPIPCEDVPFSNNRGTFAPFDTTIIKLVCPDDAIPLNSNVTTGTCDDRHGKWDIPIDMACVPIKNNKNCDAPGLVEHGEISSLKQDGEEYKEGDELRLICDKGFSLSGGADHLTCLKNGYWDKQFGDCIAATCELPAKARHGDLEPKLKGEELPFGQILNARCDYGYKLTGKSIMRCTENGWDQSVPTCRKIMCPNPGTPENGWYHGSFNFRDRVTFGCFSGYKLYGSKERICMENGKWSGQLTICDSNKQDCPDPGTPVRGLKSGILYNEGDDVSFTCESGYTLIGSKSRTCRNKKWTGQEPQCIGRNDFDDANDVSQNLKTVVASLRELKIRNRKPAAQDDQQNNPNKAALRAQNGIAVLPKENVLVVCYVFDSSSSIGEANFKKSIKLAKAISQNLGILENGGETCAITFDTTAQLKIAPTSFESVESTLTALDSIPYQEGRGTSLESAFQLFGEKVCNASVRANPNKNVMFATFLFTDGKVKQSSRLRKYMRNLKRDYRSVLYSIALTGFPNKDILFDITSSYRSAKRTFLLDSYSTLDRITRDLLGNNEIDYSVCGKGFDQSTVVEDFAPTNETVAEDGASYQLWPWTVQIFYVKDKKSVTARCLGSLISADMVLTSSLCFDRNTDPKRILTKSGVDKFHVSFAEKFIQVGGIESSAASKATIIKLKKPVTFSQYTRPVCLPSQKMDEMASKSPSSIGYTSSWSKHIQGGRYGNIARVHVKIPPTSECRDGTKQLGRENREVGTNLFCAGNAGAALEVCGPDLGSALFQYHFDSNNQPQWVQTGLALAFTRKTQDDDDDADAAECYNPSRIYNVFLNLKPLSDSIHDIIKDA